MTEEEKFLVNKLKENKNSYIRLNFVQVEFLVSLIQKQSKVIDEMVKHFADIIDNDDNASLLPFYNSDENIEEKVKQYFYRKVEEK